MKKVLKKIRLVRFINSPMRCIAKFFVLLCRRFINFSETHIVISGTVTIALPENNEIKIFSKGDDYIPTQVFWKGYTGYEASAELFYYLAKKANTIVDVGANIGLYSLLAAASNPTAQIYSFEPVERVFNRLKKQVEVNKFKNINCVQMVVGNEMGKIPFYIPIGDGIPYASSTKKEWLKAFNTDYIDGITLKHFKKEKAIKSIDLIKMDCEFHEYEVLLGLSEILADELPDLFLEIAMPESEGVKGYFENDNYLKIQSLLNSLGYSFYLIYNGALFRVDEIEFNPSDRNYFFSKYKTLQRFSPIKEFIKGYYNFKLKT